MRICLIGAGAVGGRHLSILKRLDDVELVAISDTVLHRATRAAEEFGATPYADWREMLANQEIDAVFVCTPPAAHAEPASEALRAGVHVYLEKPLARSLQDGVRILEAWESSPAVCAVGYQWRALDLLDQVRALVGKDPIGFLISRNVGPAERGRLAQAAGAQDPPWFLDPELSGGILFELASHDIDLQLALGGAVDSALGLEGRIALAQGGLRATGVGDALAVILQFASGGIGTICLGWTRDGLGEYYALDLLAPSVTLALELDPRFVLTGAADGRSVHHRSRVPPLDRSVVRFVEASLSARRDHVFCTPAEAFETLCVALACERAMAEKGMATPPRRP